MTAPKWVLKNMKLRDQRAFRSLKRKQLRALKKAANEYRLGCAYCPAKGFDAVDRGIEDLIKSHRRANWDYAQPFHAE